MIDPKQIPPEVVEAAAIADFKAWREYRNRTEEWADLLPEEQDSYRVAASAAIAAALAAWPNNIYDHQYRNGRDYNSLILPLPVEKSNG